MVYKNIKHQIYRTLIRPVIIYGCETWILVKFEQNKLLIFESKILRRIFGLYHDEETGEWRIRKMTNLNSYIECQTYWGKLERIASSVSVIHEEKKEL